MNCPSCSHAESDVIDSRSFSGFIRRRRQCRECASRFTSIEQIVDDSVQGRPVKAASEAKVRREIELTVLKDYREQLSVSIAQLEGEA